MTSAGNRDGSAIVKSMASVVITMSEAAEKARTLPKEVVQAMWGEGLMHWMNPKAARGSEPSMLEMLDTWQEMARLDGSFGWIGIANLPSAAYGAAYLNDDGFKEVFQDNDFQVTLAGQFAPNGMGNIVDGGYQVSGSWNFGSGSGHSQYVVGGFIPLKDGEMIMDEATGLPDMQIAVFPREQINFTDGWHVTGLCATGSYDYNVSDVFVPAHRTFPLFTTDAKRGGTNFKMGLMPLTAAGHAAWALGVARSALDDIKDLALEKTRMGDPSTLGNKLTFQRNFAHHEAMWRAARALVVDAFCSVEKQLADGMALSVKMRTDMRLAATYATEASREVVEFAHLAAGTTAIRKGARIERAFRDMYTGTQHAFINERTYTEAAQIMMGLIDDSTAI